MGWAVNRRQIVGSNGQGKTRLPKWAYRINKWQKDVVQRGPLRVASCRPNITPLQGPAQVCHCPTLGQKVDPQTRLSCGLLGPRVCFAVASSAFCEKQGSQGERTQCLPDKTKPTLDPKPWWTLPAIDYPDCRLVAETHHIPTSTSLPHRRQPDSLSLFFPPPPFPLTTFAIPICQFDCLIAVLCVFVSLIYYRKYA